MGNIIEQLETFQDVHRVLRRYQPPVTSTTGAYTLERMERLMEHLGNPQDSYKVVHVAGTSGKTSTAYYVAAFLAQTGKKTGLTVSPHVDEINERVQVNQKPLSEKKFCHDMTVFLRLVEKSKLRPTYFEVLTAFAFWEFKRMGCEYAVIEVGLGGLLDATNVIHKKQKLNVITDIGIDHEQVLGKTFDLIAAQKAGIIQPYNSVVSYDQGDEVMDIIREVSGQQHAELHEIWPVRSGELPHKLPLFQRRNWYLAYAAFGILTERDGLADLNETQLEKTTSILIPARMERRMVGTKTVIMDGAHNAQKIEAFVASVKHDYPKQKLPVLISLVTTKQARLNQCIEAILPICQEMIITTFSTANGEKVSVDPLKIAEACESLGFENWKIIDDPKKAYKQLLRSKSDTCIITGSFYLLNHVR